MFKYHFAKLILVLGAIIHFGLQAADIMLPNVKLLPLAASLSDPQGRLGTKIQTGTVKDSAGALARGLHEVKFTLDSAAPYAVSVEGQRVEPGQTISFQKNLTLSGSVLVLNVFPAEGKIEGAANFSVNIPNLSVLMCPVGMTETVSSCVKVEFQAPEYNCGTGYTLNSSSLCERSISIPKIKGCGTGFTLAGDTCVGGQETEAVKQCETGYSVNEFGECEKQTYDKTSQCEAGFSVIDGVCQKKSQINKQLSGCPEGSVPDTNFADICILTTIKPKSLYCQNVESSTNEQCHVINEKKICLKVDEALSACQIKTYSIAKLECPSNSTLLNGRCVIEEFYKLSADCPAGYSVLASTTTCQKIESKAPVLGCTNGYTMSGNNCSKVTSVPIESCPTGYEFVNSTCRQKKAPTLNCEAGYTLNGSRCEQAASAGAVAVCADSYDWNGEQCERVVNAIGSATCPDGYAINKSTGMCSATVSVAPEGFNCSAGYGQTANWNNTKNSKCHKLTFSVCPSGFHNMPQDMQSCYINEGRYFKKSSESDSCPAQFPYVSSDNKLICVDNPNWDNKTYYPYTMLSCEAGSTRFSSNCYSDTVYVASTGFHGNAAYIYNPSTGLMEGLSNLPPTSVICPGGFSQTYGANCQMRDLQAAIAFVCEGGWTLNGQTCSTVFKAEPITSCQSGYEPKDSTSCYSTAASGDIGNCPLGMSVSGTSCKGTHTIAATSICDPGWEQTAPAVCTKTTTVEPSITCPAGSVDFGTTCVSKLQSTPQTICKSPYTYSTKDKTCRYDLTTPKL